MCVNSASKTNVSLRTAGIPAAVFATVFVLSLYWYSNCESKTYLILAFFASLLSALLAAAYTFGALDRSRKRNLVAYAVTLGASCAIFAVVFPPFSVPDEAHHYMSSYWMVDCLLGESSISDSNYIPIRESDWDYVQLFGDPTIGVNNYRDARASFELLNTQAGMTVSEEWEFDFGSENPTAKIGSVLGISIGRLLNLGAAPTFYLGRLLTAAFYIGCCVAAVWNTPIAKGAFATASMFPMSLHLAASHSYDAGIIGLAFLLAALLLKTMIGEGKLRVSLLVEIAVVAVLLAPCKLVYASMLILLLFIPDKRFSSKQLAWTYRCAIFAMAMLAVIALRVTSIGNLASASSSGDSRGDLTGQFYTLADILSNPLRSIAILFRSFETKGDFYLFSMLGSYPGWIQGTLAVPSFFMILYLFVGLWCSQRSSEEKLTLSPLLRISLVSIAFIVLGGVMLSMLLGWTFNTENVIEGVQGRYLLPVLPLMFIACRSARMYIGAHTFTFGIAAVSVLNILYLLRMVSVALTLP